VEVWNLARNVKHTLALQVGQTYLGAWAHGFVYFEGNDQYVEDAAGHSTRLGDAFPGFDPTANGDSPEGSIASQKYIVFINAEGDVTSYDIAKKRFHKVDVTGVYGNGQYPTPAYCQAVVARHVACRGDDDDDGDGPSHYYYDLIALDGAQPRDVHVNLTTSPALTRRGLSWVSRSGVLHTMSDNGKIHAGAHGLDSAPLASAYGKAILTRRHGQHVVASLGAGKPIRTLHVRTR
jgi:hypothetical protein